MKYFIVLNDNQYRMKYFKILLRISWYYHGKCQNNMVMPSYSSVTLWFKTWLWAVRLCITSVRIIGDVSNGLASLNPEDTWRVTISSVEWRVITYVDSRAQLSLIYDGPAVINLHGSVRFSCVTARTSATARLSPKTFTVCCGTGR